MVRQTATVQYKSGLQIDAAGALCSIAMDYNCSIRLKYRGDNEANLKSVLSILGAGIRAKESVEIICDGEGEEEAIKKIIECLEGAKA